MLQGILSSLQSKKRGQDKLLWALPRLSPNPIAFISAPPGIDIIGEISAAQPTRETIPGKYFSDFIMKINKKTGILATMRQQKWVMSVMGIIK